MADVLSGLLQGVDRGFSNGLNLYKTVQDEARQKRLEQYQLDRDVINDQRYEQTWNNTLQRQLVDDDRWEKTQTWEREKYELEQKRLTAAAEATARYRQQQLNIRAAEYKLKVGKENRAIQKERQAEWNGRVKAGVEGFSAAFKDNPDAAQDLYAHDVYARIGVNQRVARAQGYELDPETASSLYAMPRPDGTYVIGRHTEEGFKPYDADPKSDGEQALVMPNDVFARTFAGTEGAEVVDSRATLSALPAQIAGSARTQATAESEAMVPQGEKLAVSLSDAHKRATALQSEITNLEGFIKAGEYRLSEQGGPSTVQNTMPKNPIDATRRRNAVVAELKAVQQQIEKDNSELQSLAADQQNTQLRAPAALSRAAPAVREIAGLPVKDRVQAAKNYSETYRENPSLANAYPGMNKREATERFTSDRTALVDRLIGGIDFKTLRDDKGKPVAATGVEAEMRSVLAGMSPELLMTLRDSTGQMEGTFQREAQRAIKSNNVQALPYMISASGKGLDSVFVATAMQDESLAQFNADQRYAVAMRAAEIKREDPARAERLGTAGLLAEAKLKLQE